MVVDPTGKKAGRGAYIHKERECLEMVLGARRGFENALKLDSALLPEDREALEQLMAVFPPRAMARESEAREALTIK